MSATCCWPSGPHLFTQSPFWTNSARAKSGTNLAMVCGVHRASSIVCIDVSQHVASCIHHMYCVYKTHIVYIGCTAYVLLHHYGYSVYTTCHVCSHYTRVVCISCLFYEYRASYIYSHVCVYGARNMLTAYNADICIILFIWCPPYIVLWYTLSCITPW